MLWSTVLDRSYFGDDFRVSEVAMLTWLNKNIFSKLNRRRNDVSSQDAALKTESEEIRSDKKTELSRIQKLHQYNTVIGDVVQYSTVPELNEDCWRIIISKLPIGGLSTIPFVSKLFNNIWNNMSIYNAPALLHIFGTKYTQATKFVDSNLY